MNLNCYFFQILSVLYEYLTKLKEISRPFGLYEFPCIESKFSSQ